MKNLNLSLVYLALLLSAACSGPHPKSLSVMTWNIWHGGLHGDQSVDFEQDTSNTANILKVIMQESPDILFMQETYCCGMDIAREAGYPYSWRGSSNLSIHSKYPIVDTIHIFRPFNSHAAIIDVDGMNILCVNIWLHYLPDSFQDIKTLSPDSLIAGEGPTRLSEIVSLLHSIDSLENSLNLPIIIGGDFNSGSHLDWVESTREYHYGKVVEWPVSKLMQERGFTDSFREAHPDPLLTLDGTWGFLSDDIISDRIDFIYFKGANLATTYSKIVQDDPPGGFFNSDHRAILSVFDLEGQEK
ncbi:MAG: endonuclease/exonuclease/phosphatase family protein [Bacteroidota bacterium]|nr:endonuclease/exonuclease/phosphatase family protein [Bacteroidota bacterium]